jgi:hypothetical protein
MPKKIVAVEPVVIVEPIIDPIKPIKVKKIKKLTVDIPPIIEPVKELELSKKTGKVKRVLSAVQLEALRLGRLKGIQTRMSKKNDNK